MSPELRTRLLRLARQVVECEVRAGTGREVEVPAPEAIAVSYGGAFVTLKNAGRLRGCIGTFKSHGSVDVTVRDMAASVVHDPRFVSRPIGVGELPKLSVEVSVLTALVPTADPLSLVPGRDGIFIRRDLHTGCFLPQVATENNWDAREFLSRCCEMKATLSPDAWRDPETEVCLFQTESFSDPPPCAQATADR
jgi:AmmeMemoRadiSam system protein A